MTIETVQTRFGQYRGKREEGCSVFRGIPYAKPPVGERRFRAPEEPDCFAGVRDAFQFGNRAMQFGSREGEFYYKEFYADPAFMPPMSEDMLYLNIWTPAESTDEALPVAFWIHGGAFLHGFGSEMEFDGAEYCKRGVILVTINYRVGAFGFLADEELSAESPQGISGNYGILDQIAALRWVFENIGAFGGDPERITVFGQSAGCMSTQTLVSSPLTKGMIAGAVLQSASGYKAGLNRDLPMKDAYGVSKQLMRIAGVRDIAGLREKSAEELLQAMGELMQENKEKGDRNLPFSPVIDGYVLPRGYNDTVDQNRHHNIPYMIGCARNDMMMEAENPKDGELLRGCMAWSLKNEELGRKPDYVYLFARRLLGDDAGAFHSSELWYMFGTLNRSWRPKTEEDYALSARMLDYWTAFMKTGVPAAEGRPVWEPCTKANPFVMELK